MTISAGRARLAEVSAMREAYSRESNCQIVRFSNLTRGFAFAVILEIEGQVAGYGAVRTTDEVDTLVEFFVLPAFRHVQAQLLQGILQFTEVPLVETQSNLPWVLPYLSLFGGALEEGPFLFESGLETELQASKGVFRTKRSSDQIFEHHSEPEGDYVVELDGKVVATGGFLTHYNPPYADLYMEVHPEFRRRGFGSFLIQQLRRKCSESGRIAAARCDALNLASYACLVRGGLVCCGRLITCQIHLRLVDTSIDRLSEL